MVALETEQTITEDAEVGQSLADLRLHRAEVFADDESAVADTFQREDADQVFVASAHVGAARGVMPRGIQ